MGGKCPFWLFVGLLSSDESVQSRSVCRTDYDSHTLKSIMHHNPTKDYMLEYEECRKTYLVPLEEMEA